MESNETCLLVAFKTKVINLRSKLNVKIPITCFYILGLHVRICPKHSGAERVKLLLWGRPGEVRRERQPVLIHGERYWLECSRGWPTRLSPR